MQFNFSLTPRPPIHQSGLENLAHQAGVTGNGCQNYLPITHYPSTCSLSPNSQLPTPNSQLKIFLQKD
ncbi:hypothetical protein [Chamaesiphon polymorphus]|uniref:hypothetical protein n=1 Tax=Chamaesiphon polymorphus TaxID=2107691 RepID=UPI0011B29284|nr:hypothetical protein [Chamaesiphon polymorphus]